MGTDDRQKMHGAHARLEGQGGPREGKQGAPRECMPAEEGPKPPQPQRPAAPARAPPPALGQSGEGIQPPSKESVLTV